MAVAETGPDALEDFDRAGADLVLLDLMLPGLSGTRGVPALRQRSNVPVIMLTAKDSEIDKVVGLEIGADDYVTKPFSPRSCSPGSVSSCAGAWLRWALAGRSPTLATASKDGSWIPPAGPWCRPAGPWWR